VRKFKPDIYPEQKWLTVCAKIKAIFDLVIDYRIIIALNLSQESSTSCPSWTYWNMET
jgi:hypothetical protein